MSSRLLAVLGCAALGACTTAAPPPQAGSLDAGWGEASRYNAAVQVIDPEPVYAAGGAQPGDHGEKAAEATKRYRTGQALAKHNSEAKQKSTTSSTSGGGSR